MKHPLWIFFVLTPIVFFNSLMEGSDVTQACCWIAIQEPDAPKQEPESGSKPDAEPQKAEQEQESEDKSKKSDSGQDPQAEKKDPSSDEKEDKKKDDEDGAEFLNKAFELKLEYRTTKDLDRIVLLCNKALDKGLDEKDEQQAKALVTSSAMEFAKAYTDKIFLVGELDVRWQYYRSLAVPKLNRVTQLDDESIEAHLLLARLQALPGGDKAQSLKSVERVIEVSTEDQQLSNAYFIRASLAKEIKDKLTDLNQAIRLNPENLDALLVRAEHFVSKSRVKRALKDYRKWLDAQPDNWEIRVRVAESLKDTGDAFREDIQKEAIAILNEAIALKDDLTVSYTMKAEILAIGKRHDEVVDAASEALRCEPKNVKALKIRATALAELKKFDAAIEDADKLVELQGLSLDGFELRGIIRIQQGNLDEAIKDFDRLSKANPSDANLKEHLASLYNANDQPTEAIRVYNQLLRRARKSVWEDKGIDVKLVLMGQRVDLLRGRGDAYLSCGKHSDAVEDFQEGVSLLKEINEIQKENGLKETAFNEILLNNLAWVLATSPDDDVRDGELAIKLATQAAELTEYKQAYILSTLASGYAETGEFDIAIEWIEKALELNREVAAKADDKSETDRQFKSLNEELDSYRNNKAWRERQDVENEKKAAETEKGDEKK